MATSIGEAVLTISLDDSPVKKGMKGIGATVKKHSKAIGIGMTAMGATILGSLGLAVKGAVDFESAMREVNTMMGMSQGDFAAFSKDVQDLASDLGVDAVDSANALYQAISAGVPKDNAIDFLAIATKAAIGGVTDTETAVDGLTTVINAFKLPMSDAQKVADLMFTTVKGGKTTFEELSGSLFQVAPIAAAAGVSFEEVSAALATMTKQGVPTSVATTQLRQAMVALQKPTKEMNTVINDLGYESGQVMLEELGLAEALQALREASGDSNEMLMKMFGSVEAGGAVLALTGDNATMFKTDLDAMANSTGAATDAFNEMENSASRQAASMTAMFNDIKVTVGNVLLPILKDLIANIKPIIGNIKNWVQENPGLTKTIVLIVTAVGGLLTVLGPLLIMLPGIISALPILGAAFAVLTGPVGLAILAIAALVAAGVALTKNWDIIMRGLKRVTETVFNFIIGSINGLIRALNKIPLVNIKELGKVGAPAQGLTERTKAIMARPFEEFAGGGLIPEPTMLYGLRSKRPYGIAGEAGPERIVPGSGGAVTNNFQIAQLVVREEADVQRIARELYIMQQDRVRGAGG